MKSWDFSRLSVGITYRFDIKKALISQLGALLALVMTMISDKHFPFGDEPIELFSSTTILILINVGILTYTLMTLGSSTIKLFPSMLIYDSRTKQVRLDFARVTRLEVVNKSNLQFYVLNYAGKEEPGLKIKNVMAYKDSKQLLEFLRYILKEKFVQRAISFNDRKKFKAFNIGTKN